MVGWQLDGDPVLCQNKQAQVTRLSDIQAQLARRGPQLACQDAPRVALYFNCSRHFLVALLAVWQQGRTAVILPNVLPATLRSMQPHFDLLLTDQQPKTSSPVAQWLWYPNLEPVMAPLALQPDWPLVVFTSGSTGEPKGVGKSLAQLAREAEDLGALFRTRHSGLLTLATVSHQHMYGLLFKVIWPLLEARPFMQEPLQFPEDMPKQPLLLVTSPALLKRLVGPLSPEQDLRLCFSSGGPLDLPAAEKTHALWGLWPFEIYGSTETGGIAMRNQKLPNAPWQALPRVTLRTQANEQGGLLQIQSAYLPTMEWYQADDLVELAPKGQFRLLGRSDRIVKLEEKRVSLVQVEQAIKRLLPQAAELRLLPWQQGRRQCLACVVALPKSLQLEVNLASLRRALALEVEPIAIPKVWRLVDELPVNSMGKTELASLESLIKEVA